MGFGGMKMKSQTKKLADPVTAVGEKEVKETGPTKDTITGMQEGAVSG